MSPWDSLLAELENWERLGLRASLWWRDDDAVAWTPELSQLLEISQDTAVPVALAVIPRDCAPGLVRELSDVEGVTVLQHGYSHSNYAGAGEKQTELGDHRPPIQVLAELRHGRSRLSREFGTRFHAVLVPPWNRISERIVASLDASMWVGMSTFGPRRRPRTDSGMVVANSHVDIVAWRSTRAFVGLEKAIEQVLAHLRARRTGVVDGTEPTGLMTHHLYHDPACWQFCRELLYATKGHPAAVWLSSREVFLPGLPISDR